MYSETELLLLLLTSVFYFSFFLMLVESFLFFALVGWAGGERGETRNAQMRCFFFIILKSKR